MKKYILCQFPFILDGGKNKKKNNITDDDVTIDNLKEDGGEELFIKEFNFYCKKYPYTPSIIPSVSRIITMGDIHGDFDLAIKLLKLGNLIKHENNKYIWIGGETIVVQVGDQIDRCRPIGHLGCQNDETTYKDEASDIKILNLFTDLDIQARKTGGMVISLLGNHELMNSMGQLTYVSKLGINEFSKYKDQQNPNKLFDSPEEARKYAFSPGKEYGNFLGCTRLPAVIIGSNLFVHAGMIDSIIDLLNIKEKTDIKTINVAIKKWLLGILDIRKVKKMITSKNSIFWTRILGGIPPNIDISNEICKSNIDNVLKIFKINNLIIGHTPQSFAYNDGINSTCDGKIWRVDNGSSSAFHKFDEHFMKTGNISHSRRPQILEIINDNIYNIIG